MNDDKIRAEVLFLLRTAERARRHAQRAENRARWASQRAQSLEDLQRAKRAVEGDLTAPTRGRTDDDST